MKLSKLKETLMSQLPENMKPIGLGKNGNSSSERVNPKMIMPLSYEEKGSSNGDTTLYNNEGANLMDDVKIIGIVGSRGKTTTAKIIHEYLIAKGYKSMLYSSAEIFSPAGTSAPGEGSETPLFSEGSLLRILVEAEAYQPNFLVLEVNETSISRGLAKNIPFAAKVLTNIYKNHHSDQESSEEYINTIKTFFKTNDLTTAVNVFGLTGDLTREEFNELLNLNSNASYTFGSKYIAERRNANYEALDVLLYHVLHDMNGLHFEVEIAGKELAFDTKLLLPHNTLNLTCAITTLKALGIFEANIFSKAIANLKVEGREELFCMKDRKVMVGMFLAPTLEVLADYRNKGQINKIRVVTGAPGTGFKGWDPEFMTEFFISQRSKVRKQAMDYARAFADFVYLTENDSGADDPQMICSELQNYLKGSAAVSEIIVNREEAIRTAIEDCESGDIVFIAGRGNRNVLVVGENKTKILKDSEFVKEILKEASPS
ncbi:MAG: Mur ligase family protein [Erysipelotrichales bacterium]|nr:Mur ligase family protein [Erysipelotrichales bacterium]